MDSYVQNLVGSFIGSISKYYLTYHINAVNICITSYRRIHMDPDLPRDVTLAIAFMIAVCFVYFVWEE